MSEAEGGGLAEREFLFREVGLERWLNGLDLDGQDTAARIEKRRQKFEKRRTRRKEANGSEESMKTDSKPVGPRDVLRYGPDAASPVEKLDDSDSFNFSSDSDDDTPPEAAGQIKVAMFRVLASGEIKRGEYSPQFDAHDDDEDGNKGGDEGDIDHTTSFAKPKTLDPKSISTQTVTGIDGPDKPFAVFTFFYRGESKFLIPSVKLQTLMFYLGQLQKMGIVSSKQQKLTPGAAKRSSRTIDFGTLGALKPDKGTVGFSTFRDNEPSRGRKAKSRKKSNGSIGAAMEEDSDEDEEDAEVVGKMEDIDDKEDKSLLSPDDAKFSGELADGVGRIKVCSIQSHPILFHTNMFMQLKRQHSADPMNSRKSPASGTTSLGATPPAETISASAPKDILPNNVF